MKTKTAFVLFIFLICLIAVPVHAEQMKQGENEGYEKHQAMIADNKSEKDKNLNIQLLDLELVTQDGKPVRFKSDVIGDKLVAMTFIWTHCTTICPVYNAIFMQLQELLGDRQGKEVILVSLTLDPSRDIPRRMKREAKKFKAKPGWFYLTGKKKIVNQVLQGLDAYYVDYEDHPPMALIGDGKTGTWRRLTGFPRPQHLLTMIDELKAARE